MSSTPDRPPSVIRRGAPFADGLTQIVTDRPGGLGLGFGILRLRRGEKFPDTAGTERVYMLLSGSVDFRWNGGSFAAARASMVEELPASLFVGAAESITVATLSETAELAVFTASKASGPTLQPIPAGKVRTASLSPPNLDGTADRRIRTVVDDANAPGSSLTLGEVVNLPGRWSSFPPHHHSQIELYHYRFFPEGGFGFCGLGDDAFIVHDGDTVVIQPGLTHPQVAAPGCSMIYLWAIRHLEGDRFGPDSRIYPSEYGWAL